MQIMDKKYLISVILVSLIILSSVFFAGSENILKYVCAIVINCVFVIYQRSSNLFLVHVTGYLIWLILFNVVLFLYGAYTPYGGYSFPFHMCIVVSVVLIYTQMLYYEEQIEIFLLDISLCSSMMIFIYLFIYERGMLLNKIYTVLKGMSWYRLGRGVGVNSNSIGLILSILSIQILYGLFTTDCSKQRLYLVLMLLINSVEILLTGSKKGLFILIFLVFVMPVVTKKSNKFKGVIIGISVAMAILYLVLNVELLYNIMGHRIADMLIQFGIKTSLKTTALSGESTSMRIDMIKEAMEMFWEHPIFGNGWNCFADKSGFGMYSHTNYTEILVSMGLFGFVCFYYYYIVLFAKLFKYRNSMKARYLMLIIAICFFIDGTSINAYGSIIDFLIISIVFCQYPYVLDVSEILT